MRRMAIIGAACLGICLIALAFRPVSAWAKPESSAAAVQPTVTATIGGLNATLREDEPQYNVRSGPSTSAYPVIGMLLPGQTVLIKGRSPGGEWVEIYFPGVPGNVGWVASIYLNIPPGLSVPISEPPPTPAPQYTATIDPTLAAQFIVTPVPTRLPTFTPPPPLVIPTLPPATSASAIGGVPMEMVILILAGLGVFLGLVSLIRGR